MMRSLFGLLASVLFFQSTHAADTSVSEIYLGSREGDPASLVENVSTIHGDYIEVEVDLTVTSPDSLVVSRFYSSRDTLPIATFGGWRFYPQCFLTMQKDPQGQHCVTTEGKFERTVVYLGNPDGSILTYVGWRNLTHPNKRVLFKIDAETECSGIANTAKGDVGAWKNLKNHELYYNSENDSFELCLCTEGKRFYIKNPRTNVYTITHEILPSGNKIFYQFNNKGQLEFIKETNASEKQVLAWIKIGYGSTVHLETSDGQTVDYQFQQDPSGDLLLTSVIRSDKPNLHYQYQVVNGRALLVKKALPEGRFVEVDYDTDKNNQLKVKSVKTPVNSESTDSVYFVFDGGSTEVSGPGSCKSVYRFDEKKQLVAVEQYLNGALYRIHRKSWGRKSAAGNLLSTSLADASGNIVYHMSLEYDTKGNIVEEREYGDISGAGPIALAFDEKGVVSNKDGSIKYYSYFSGKNTHGFFQKDTKGTGVKYWYKKGTNLLIKKFVLTKGSADSEEEDYHSDIKQRFFYFYNDDAALSKVIIDDGVGGDSTALSFRQRTITQISPKQAMPNVGAPEVVQQKYSTQNGKSECLIKRIVNHFDGQGNVSAQEVYDANDEHRYTIHKRHVHRLLVSETDPLGNETAYFYDANQNLVQKTHADTGRSIEYGYDLRNRLVRTVEKDKTGSASEMHVTYDASGYKCQETDCYGNITCYENDTLGRPIHVTYPKTSNGPHASLVPTYTYAYDLFDHPISVTDPKGNILKKTHNLKGNPAEIDYPDGTKELFRYDSGGNLHHHFRRDGLVEVFEYDYIGRPSRVDYWLRGTNPSENKSSPFKCATCEYTTFHKQREIDRRGVKTTYTHDGCGRLTRLEKGSEIVDFSYDALGRTRSVKKWKSAQDFSLEVREYDLLNRVIEERTESASGQVLLRRRFVYNDAGELAQIIGYPQNKESVLMWFAYDGFGRIIQTTNASGNSTQVVYDDTYVNGWGQRGTKRTIIDAMGNRTEEIFDHDDHRIQVLRKEKTGTLLSCLDTSYDCTGNQVLEKAAVFSADQQSNDFAVAYTYTSGDQLDSITVGKGNSDERMTRFEYTIYGKLIKISYPGTTPSVHCKYYRQGDLEALAYEEGTSVVKHVLYQDFNHNLTYISQGNFHVNYTYDDNERMTSETVTDEFGNYKVSRTYDGEGKVKTLLFPDGSYVEYVYTGPLVKSVSRFNKNNTELYKYTVASRDLMGNPTQEILPGSLGMRMQTWDESARRVGIATDYFQDHILEYDALDNIKMKVTSLSNQSHATEYAYNALLQLISEKTETEHSYSYDSIGNRLKKDHSPYKINGLNELIRAEGCAYTYHPNGNRATKVIGGSWFWAGHTWIYQSNPLNQIVSIKDDQTTINYFYDITGKRFNKRVVSKTKKCIQRFFYIDNTEIGCLDERGNIVELKVPSDPNDPESPAIAIEIGQTIYVPIYDLQGNIACLLDPFQAWIVENYRYTAFGEEHIFNENGQLVIDSSVGNPWRFKGKRIDQEIGLIYFGYRYYDPKLGRWLSPDPMGTIDGPNLYAFTRNNPMRYVDYFGLHSEIDPNCGCIEHGHPGWHNAPPGCVCICGRNERNVGPYSGRLGGDIKSVLGGFSHGVVDYLIDSIHGLQMTATYIGAAELDMSLHERIHMIEALEQSQMQQMAAVGSDLMDMMGIDEANALYQSLRSKTTLGLEVGSLIAGGYGIAKGAISLTRAVRVPVSFGRLSRWPSPAKGRSIINGIEYTTHALERMSPRGLIQNGNEIVGRGVPPSVVENAIKFGAKTMGNTPHEIVHRYENVRVVTNLSSNRVITVITTVR
jgi:RHS repeat-associated protein